MRILHTSDWHLGRAFHGVGMLEHQAAFLDHLVDLVHQESVDLVVVSGDVYDRGLPPVDAVRIFDEAVTRLAASGARTVITSGNHDSARRLGFASPLIDAAGVHLRTDAGALQVPVVLDDADGPVAVYGLPYLDPDTMRRTWGLDQRSHHATLSEAMRLVREDLANRPGARSVVLAHAFVAGAAPTDSERDIRVGGVDRVPTSVFEGVDYVALGHLHGAQVLDERMRYSGSPLAYSFSEAGQVKGSWLIDMGVDSLAADFIAAPVPRRVARLRGRLDDLLAQPEHSDLEDAWLQVTLTDEQRPRDPMERLRQRFPHTLSLVFEATTSTTLSRRPLAGRSDHDVTLDFVGAVRGRAADDAEASLLREAVEACCGVQEADVVVTGGGH